MDPIRCVLYDCPECALPATVTTLGYATSTGGTIEIVSVDCVNQHRFLGSAERLRVLLPIADASAP